jgi:hypothetical protein
VLIYVRNRSRVCEIAQCARRAQLFLANLGAQGKIWEVCV